MGETVPETVPEAATPKSGVRRRFWLRWRPLIPNAELVQVVKQGRHIATDLQRRSIDDQDPTLALRAHEIREIGGLILERLLIAQGGQEALDELNRNEQAAGPPGIRAVLPHQ